MPEPEVGGEAVAAGAGDPKPVCFLLDTNAWVGQAHYFLRERGARLLEAVAGRPGATLVLPELVLAEIRENIRREFEGPLRVKARFTSSLVPPPELADVFERLEASVAAVEGQLGKYLLQPEISSDLAKRALVRTVQKRAPAHAAEETKDCYIWELALDLQQEYRVLLVTKDNAFYEGAKTTTPHPDLTAEANDIELFKSLELALQRVSEEMEAVEFDADEFTGIFDQEWREKLARSKLLENYKFVGDPKLDQAHLLLRPSKEKDSVVAVYRVNYPLEPREEEAEQGEAAEYAVTGSGVFNPAQGTFSENSLDGQELTLVSPSGKQQTWTGRLDGIE